MTSFVPAAQGPRLYYMNPLAAGPIQGWAGQFQAAAALGFSHVLLAPPFRPARHGSLFLSASHDELHPDLGWFGDAAGGLLDIARMAQAAGLSLMLDLVAERVADGSPLARAASSPFCEPHSGLDPRRFDPDGDAAYAPLGPPALPALIAFWRARLADWASLGVSGVRLLGLNRLPPALLAGIAGSGVALYGWLPGVPIAALGAFEGSGLDYVFSSMPWWDGRSDWFWREEAALRRIAPVIHPAEVPFAPRCAAHGHAEADRRARQRQVLSQACLLGTGWMMVMGQEHGARRRLDPRRSAAPDAYCGGAAAMETTGDDLATLIAALNALRDAAPALSGTGAPRLLTGPGAPVLAIERPMAADPRLPGDAALVAINRTEAPQPLHASTICGNLGGYFDLQADTLPQTLAPGASLAATLPWRDPARAMPGSLCSAARQGASAPRIAIEAVSPVVDGGTFPARFCVGEIVAVEADILCDGHELLAAELRWLVPGEPGWHHAPMRLLGNDRWTGDLPLTRMGRTLFTVEAWKDVFGTFHDELTKKAAAGLDLSLEAEEGRLLVVAALRSAGERRAEVQALADRLHDAPVAERVALLLAPAAVALMRAADGRAFATWIDPALPLEAERTAARFASWYELFPRSMSGDPQRHGTFADVIAQLPRIAAMGFDVLYFPPIHPIGLSNRKGRNNALVATDQDPGSPYGIADHTAIHAQLGSFEDFHALRDAALRHGLELALDFAIQCAPDHPWLQQHPGWFDWRPDGSIRYAENPPKKYQDIVNVDFYKPDAVDGLWAALCEVVLFWCKHGVRIFRVDNPHTKPLPFWRWMIDTVHEQHPDVLFLAEAFTRPKMMNRLAKVGFSQSYTYFTWRNTRREFEAYLTELTTTAAQHFFRPNFFVNTPDINPVFLQHSGRPGHLIRAALATMLAGLWGMYCGFELCEATPLPEREEYLDSEKYQLRAWDWDRPGNIVAEITQLNWMRRLNPALQTHLGLTFLPAANPNVLAFEKATPDRSNVIVVAITLDPVVTQQSEIELALWRWKLPDWASVEVDDLVSEARFTLTGKVQQVRLDPQTNPYAVWRVRPA